MKHAAVPQQGAVFDAKPLEQDGEPVAWLDVTLGDQSGAYLGSNAIRPCGSPAGPAPQRYVQLPVAVAYPNRGHVTQPAVHLHLRVLPRVPLLRGSSCPKNSSSHRTSFRGHD
jgi:hypothetical protein